MLHQMGSEMCNMHVGNMVGVERALEP
jgi:hypothetical protein